MHHAPPFPSPAPMSIEDPLEPDAPTDVPVATTRRGLCRVAFVAAEAAARFQLDGAGHDPVAWMLSPRRLFGGAAALDACLERDPFRRAVLLHALALGLDASADEIDAIGEDDGEPDKAATVFDDRVRDLHHHFYEAGWRTLPAIASQGLDAPLSGGGDRIRARARVRFEAPHLEEDLLGGGLRVTAPVLIAPSRRLSLASPVPAGLQAAAEAAPTTVAAVVRGVGLPS